MTEDDLNIVKSEEELLVKKSDWKIENESREKAYDKENKYCNYDIIFSRTSEGLADEVKKYITDLRIGFNDYKLLGRPFYVPRDVTCKNPREGFHQAIIHNYDAEDELYDEDDEDDEDSYELMI